MNHKAYFRYIADLGCMGEFWNFGESSDKLTREGAPWTCPHQVINKFYLGG